MLVRCYQLAFIRLGAPDEATATRTATRLLAGYPSGSVPLDRELCQLVVYLHVPEVVAKTVPLLGQTEAQVDRLLFLEMLSGVNAGWTRESTGEYFQALARASANAAAGLIRNTSS